MSSLLIFFGGVGARNYLFIVNFEFFQTNNVVKKDLRQLFF